MPSVAPIEEENARMDEVERQLQLMRERILHSLEIFPFLSRSMIHMSLGTATPVGLWQPLLEKLVEDGEVVCTEVHAKTPLNRSQAYTLYHLSSRTYTPTTNAITTANKPLAGNADPNDPNPTTQERTTNTI